MADSETDRDRGRTGAPALATRRRRQFGRRATVAGIWALSLLVAVPGIASRAGIATIDSDLRSRLVMQAITASNPQHRNMIDPRTDSRAQVRIARLAPRPARVGVRWRPATRARAKARIDSPAAGGGPHAENVRQLRLANLAPSASLPPAQRPADLAARHPHLSTRGRLPEAPVAASLRPTPRPAGISKRVVHYKRAWLRSVPLRPVDAQTTCLATAIYHEARGETLKGQFAVAEVVLNRVTSGRFPDTICGVVFDGVREGRIGGCQFSFACDGRSDNLRNRGAADIAKRIAQVMADGGHRGLTDGALFFHTTAIRPGWSHRMERTARYGAHLFYRG